MINIRKSIKKAELIKHRTYKTDEAHDLFLELVYRIWYTDGSIERIRIPNIRLVKNG